MIKFISIKIIINQQNNVINFNNLRNANNHMDFEDEVNKKYGLFPII